MDLYMSLVRAPEDPPLEDAGYQRELDEVGNFTVRRGLTLYSAKGSNALGGGGIGYGEFVVYGVQIGSKVIPALITVLSGALGAWLHARYGRKVRLKIGDIEAEAQTREEVEKLLARALEIQQHIEPKRIHEP